MRTALVLSAFTSLALVALMHPRASAAASSGGWQQMCEPMWFQGELANESAPKINKALEKRGAEGWELVAFTQNSFQYWACFKRPIAK